MPITPSMTAISTIIFICRLHTLEPRRRMNAMSTPIGIVQYQRSEVAILSLVASGSISKSLIISAKTGPASPASVSRARHSRDATTGRTIGCRAIVFSFIISYAEREHQASRASGIACMHRSVSLVTCWHTSCPPIMQFCCGGGYRASPSRRQAESPYPV
jgi:hypothetical protein